MYSGALCENGPMTGVTANRVNTTMAIILENKITGHRRPRNGPSEIHTHVSEYTAVKAFPRVGYSFCRALSASSIPAIRVRKMRLTYDLGNRVNYGFALLIVCLEPENKCCEWLRSKWLHREDKSKK
jgi:hypothetical protein